MRNPDVQFESIVRNGTFFFPATRHYQNGSNVVCDRCARTNLPASIGYGDQDLCLACADRVSNQMNSSGFGVPPIRRLDQVSQIPRPIRDDPFHGIPPMFQTRMEFGSAFPQPRGMDDGAFKTKMEQGEACPNPPRDCSQLRDPKTGMFLTSMMTSQAFPNGTTMVTDMQTSRACPRDNSSKFVTYMQPSHARQSD